MLARLIIAALLATPTQPAQVATEEVPKWTVQPATAAGPTGRPHYVYDGKPGQQFEDYVALSNLGDKTLSFTVYATDGYTASDGSFALLPLLDPPTKLGSWLGMPPRSYFVPEGKRVIIPVKFAVPGNAGPGDHAAGIVASVTEQTATPEGNGSMWTDAWRRGSICAWRGRCSRVSRLKMSGRPIRAARSPTT